ncbi:Addiction module toxin, RelE/StbE family (fragment) [Tepidanaerobacter acetatoxydans Re1]|uniref:Addiction module toxin, RelE/StbE family n=1 Tax=Tepidanaerobacter acetatoxydans (strain DSM 21804 / JCM 16047 / Re1) TaxID=1209989 RepID=U4QDK6_TEPAE
MMTFLAQRTDCERFFKLKEKPLKNAYKTALLKLNENPYIG